MGKGAVCIAKGEEWEVGVGELSCGSRGEGRRMWGAGPWVHIHPWVQGGRGTSVSRCLTFSLGDLHLASSDHQGWGGRLMYRV